MKNIIFFLLLSSSMSVSMLDACQSECSAICNKWSAVEVALVNAGKALDSVQVPHIGKLTNILPFAVVSFCLQNFPKQTMALISGLTTYYFYKHDVVNRCIDFYHTNFSDRKKDKNIKRQELFSDDFFVFDGDTAEDAEEQEDTEDELLAVSLEEDDESDDDKAAARKAPIKRK